MIKKIKKLLLRMVYAKQPSFIMSSKYLINSSNKNIKIHRAIFFRNFKRADLIVINLIAIVRWVGYCAWINSYKVCKTTSKEKLPKAGLKNRFSLYLKLLKLSVINFIPPNYYFRFNLYENDFVDFFYSKENSILHLYSDRNFNQPKQVRNFISDKYAFLEFLEKNNLQPNYSSKTTLEKILKDSSLLFKKCKVFCKPNVANRSIGALCIDYDSLINDYKLLTLIDKKEVLGKSNILNFIKEYYSANETILIEKFIEDADDIKKLSQHPTDTTTMRIITASIDGSNLLPETIYIQLEIPLLENNNEQQFYNILPLDIKTLDIDLTNMPDFKDKEKFEGIQISANLKQKVSTAIDMCLKVHSKLEIRAIAFDVILSPQQPIIIEANYNWDIELLYRSFRPNDLHRHIAQVWLENL